MAFLNFLQGVERQINPLDNNATFKNPKGTGNASAATQAKNLGFGFLKSAAQLPVQASENFSNTFANLGNRLGGGQNQTIQQNLGGTAALDKTLKFSGATGKNVQLASDAAQVGFSFLGPGASKVIAPVVAKTGLTGTAAKLATEAGTGAVVGAPFNAASNIANNPNPTLGNTLHAAAVGAGIGGAIPLSVEGIAAGSKAIAPALKSGAQKASLTPRVNLVDQNTLRDYSDALVGTNKMPANELSDLIRQARDVGQKYGINLATGSMVDKLDKVNSVLDQIGQKNKEISEGGYIKLPGEAPSATPSPDGITQLAKASTLSQVQDIMKGTPQAIIDKVAPAIAHTTDPNIVKNILDKALSPSPSPAAPSLTAPSVNDINNPKLAGQGSGLPTSGATPVTSGNPVENVVNALRQGGVEKLQSEQKSLYSTERSSRLGAAQNTGDLTGREATYAQLGALKGALPRVDASALVDHLKSVVSPDDVSGILDTLRTHPKLSGFEPITAQNTIIKLFDDGKLPTESEFKILQKALGSDFTDSLKTTALDSMSTLQKVKNFALQVLGVPKSIMASGDFSGGGRQGIILGSRYPEIWAQAQKDSVKAFASKDFYEKQLSDIKNNIDSGARASIYKQMGLDLAATGSHEEQYASTLGERIPIVGKMVEASDRAYTLGLTEQRFGAAEHILNTLEENGFKINQKSALGIKYGGDVSHNLGELSPSAVKALGKFINTASGRGSGKVGGIFEKYAPVLGDTLFSPRLWKSRLDMLNPVYYAKLDGPAQKLALQSAGTFASIAAAVLGIASAAGGTVVTDPRSSDFLKIKVGDTRYDVLSGFQQNLVFAWREISGQKKNSLTGNVTNLTSGKFGQANRLSVLTDLIQNKENPAFGPASDILKGTDKSGNPVNPVTDVAKLFIPLNAQDTYQTVKNTGSLPAGLLKATVPGTVGVGVGTYGIKDLQPTAKQKAYIQQLQKNGASQGKIAATTSFFQTLKAAPSRVQASADINQALAKGDRQKALQIAQTYNQAFVKRFDQWRKQYGGYRGDPTLVKAYNSGKLNLSSSDVNARIKSIKVNPLYDAVTGR